MGSRLARPVAVVIGLFIGVIGVWALVDPQSFYDQLATFPPFNRHLFHDIGAFQVGIGATLVLAAFAGDALLVALTGGAVGAVLHAISHFVDRDLGGQASDPWLLSLLALVLVAAALLRTRGAPRRTP